MPQRSGIEVAQLGERETLGRQCETEVRVGELGAKALTRAEEELFVVVGELRQLVERMSARVVRQLRVELVRHEPEVAGGELA